MTVRTNFQAKIKWALRWGALLVPLVLCGLLLTATTSSQQEDDSTRRSWDKQFEEARAKARGQTVVKPSATNTKPQTTTPPKPSPGATTAGTANEELIGITFWRLRPATSDNSGQPSLSVQQRGVGIKSYRLERADAETPFREGEMVRFSVETTRAGNRYLYVIDREVYADKTMGDPYLIFPTRATPTGGNVIAAGKIAYVPAQGDPVPYFMLQRKRPDHVGEMLTLILSPEPLPFDELPANGAPLKLDAALVKQWEQQWGGPTERREARGGVGKEWTKAEQAAERGQSVLKQDDPLPQMIYRVKSNQGGKVVLIVPLRIASQAGMIQAAASQSQPELTLQTPHSQPITAFAVSPNGQWLATGSGDKTVRIWDPSKGSVLRTFFGHTEKIIVLAISADGRRLASGDDSHIVKIWDVVTGGQLLTFQAGLQRRFIVADLVTANQSNKNKAEKNIRSKADQLRDIAFSTDGQVVIAASDNKVLSYDVDTGKQIRSLSLHYYAYDDPQRNNPEKFAPTAMTLSTDGRMLAVGGGRQPIQVWNLEKEKLLLKLEQIAQHKNPDVKKLAFSADTRFLAGETKNGHIFLREVKPNAYVTSWEAKKLFASDIANLIGFSSDGRLLTLLDSQGSVEVRDLSTSTPTQINIGLHSDPSRITFDGRWLTAIRDDRTIQILEWFSGKHIATVPAATKENTVVSEAGAIAFSPDGRRIAISDSNGNIEIWDINSSTNLRMNTRLTDPVRSMTFSSDGQSLVAVSPNAVKIWEVATGREQESLSLKSGILLVDGRQGRTDASSNQDTTSGSNMPSSTFIAQDASLSLDGRWLASITVPGQLKIWDFSNRRELPLLEKEKSKLNWPVAISSDGQWAAIGEPEKNRIQIWDLSKGHKRHTLGTQYAPIEALAISPDSQLLVTGGGVGISPRSIFRSVFDPERLITYALLSTLPGGSVIAPVLDTLKGIPNLPLRFQPIKIWEISTGRELRALSGHTGNVNLAIFSPDGRYLVTSTRERPGSRSDNMVKIWDVATLREVQTLTHPSGVDSMAFSPDGRILATACGDNSTRFWDFQTGEMLATLVSLPDSPDWLVVTPDGHFDTSNVEEINGLRWIVPDEPFRALPPEIFMRGYYEPRLLPRRISGEQLHPVRNLSTLNRVQPAVQIVEIKLQATVPDVAADAVTVKVEVANATGTLTRDSKPITLESGVYDLRLFRDGQLVGYAPEQDGPIKLESGKATITFKDIKLPRRADLKQVEFSAYAFNVDRVKSETARQTYVLPRLLPSVKGRAYVIAVGVNAYENAALDLNFAANDARRLQGVLTEKLMATGEYEEVVPLTLLSDYEWKDGRRTITAQQATKGNIKLVLDLLAGRQFDPARLAGIANADKLRQARPEDLVILSFASHGYADEAGRFYFVTYDTGADGGREITPAILQRSISSDELSRWLRDVDAGELVMIVDACQSAAAVEGEGFKPGPMGSRGLGQLAYDKGMRILAATQADNAALEHGLIRQGLLTYALVRDGIELGRADFKPEDKTITLGEWLEYARDRVPQLFAEIRSGQVRSGGPAAADMPKVILLPQKNAQPNQAGATRLFLQGKPIGASGNLTLAEEQIQQPALFDYARKRRDVLLLRK